MPGISVLLPFSLFSDDLGLVYRTLQWVFLMWKDPPLKSSDKLLRSFASLIWSHYAKGVHQVREVHFERSFLWSNKGTFVNTRQLRRQSMQGLLY